MILQALPVVTRNVHKSRRSWDLCKVSFRCIGINKLPDGGSGISRTFEPDTTEVPLVEKWKENYKNNVRINGKHFTDDNIFRMILPPPNVTGKLHLGHALTVSIQDTIIRWKIMNGASIKYIPGFDHAGIATHSVVRRKLQSKSGAKPGSRSGFVVDEKVLQDSLVEFSANSRDTIRNQLQRIGALLDWESEYYTMDENHRIVVEEAFVTLLESGIIQRKTGLVNWCCALQSSIADVECVNVEFDGKVSLNVPGYEQSVEFGQLYYVNYKLENSDETLPVATSRPETMFGDVALAVNPNDGRYASMIGSRVLNPLSNSLIPVIADERVKIEFGSGVLKLTPAHDRMDFQIGCTHNLPVVNILHDDGRLNELCGSFRGLGRFAGRKAVIKHLKERNVLTAVKEYQGNLSICSRTGDVVEPKTLPHWFMQTQIITQRVLSAINSGELKIEPDFAKVNLVHQLTNTQDWCLSRQIRWGHAIPAYYHFDHPEKWVAALDKEAARRKLEKLLNTSVSIEHVKQDSDVLDTWFSSALIPLAVSGWPDIDEKHFQPLSLMETGHDILLFWVWRMTLVSLALIDKLPFRHVLLHGMVTDPYNRKMSKSRGNVIDPMDIICGKTHQVVFNSEMLHDAEVMHKSGELDKNEYKLRTTSLKKDYPKGFAKCGADALRLTLLSQDLRKTDLRLDPIFLDSCRHFSNKMWQALRFYFAHVDKGINHPTEITKPLAELTQSVPDRWIISCLYNFAKVMEENMINCRFHTCTDAMKNFIHLQFCDFYIEMIKQDLKDGINAEARIMILRYIFGTTVKLIHPIMPFISEEMWRYLTKGDHGLLINATYPKSAEVADFYEPALMQAMSVAMKLCSEIRNLRRKVGVENWTTASTFVEATSQNFNWSSVVPYVERLTNTKIFMESPSRISRSSLTSQSFEYEEGKTCRVSMAKVTDDDSIHIAEEKLRRLQAKLDKIRETLSNPSFLETADNESKQNLLKKMEKLQSQISSLRTTKHS